ncbi:MAG TPA: ogr/Delta-like zinc finger family protein [Xanthobacteraceae bacterium]|nr:ogr/Delta-like zinc finger family protein [Xanthobacteraceae bacterium]
MRARQSSLPSLLIPCPNCLQRMAFRSAQPLSQDLADMTYACQGCGAELVRTLHRSAFECVA